MGRRSRIGSRLRGLASPLGVRDFRLVWGAQLGSEAADWAARLSLAVLVQERTGSALLSGLVTTVSLLPWVGVGQVLATLGDRLPRRTVLIASDLVRAAVFGLMLLPLGVPVILALALLAGFATPPFQAARSALLPEVLPRERYGDGLALTQVTAQLALVTGYLSGGGLVATVGADGALLVNAASFVFSAVLLAGLRGGREPRRRRSVGRQLRAAARVLRGDPLLLHAALLVAVSASGAVAGEALVAPYVQEVTGGPPGRAGVLAAMVPIGTILGSALVVRQGDHRRLLRASAGLVLAGTVPAGAGFAAGVGFPAAALPFIGIGVIFAVVVPANVVVGERVPGDSRASVFGLLQGSLQGGLALGAAAGGWLSLGVGVGPACALLLLPGVAHALLVLTRWARPAPGGDRPDRRDQPHPAALALGEDVER